MSIVVLTWNGKDLLLDCLESLDREIRSRSDAERLETEVLVVDNGSRDGSVEAVRERFPWVELIALPRNIGFAAGNNAGLRKARGRIVVLLNNDTVVLRDGLERCARYLEAHPDVGVVGPQLLHPDGRKQNSIHNFPSLVTELIPKVVLEILLPRRFPSKRFQHREPLDVDAVLGACLVVREEVVESVGPLPEDYFFFLEETDWCFRIRRAGWRIVHLPEARLIHIHGAGTKKRVPLETRIEYHRSLYHFLRKNRGAWQAFLVMGLRMTKLALALILLAPATAVSQRERERWRQRAAILAWHLRGRPAAAGLAGVRATTEEET
jgi:GT2 family glycosyltransferase